MQLKHNILKLYLLKGFLWFMVSMPIIVLFFQENGLTLMEVMILQSVYSLTVAITEIPSVAPINISASLHAALTDNAEDA